MVNSKNGINIINNIPLDRILLETDGPFTEYKGQKSTPLMTEFIINELSKISGSPIENMADLLQSNFKSLLS